MLTNGRVSRGGTYDRYTTTVGVYRGSEDEEFPTYTNRVDEDTSEPMLRYESVLSNVVTSHGDFIHPNRHSWVKEEITYLNGSTVYRVHEPGRYGSYQTRTSTTKGVHSGVDFSSPINLSALIDLNHNALLAKLYEKLRGSLDLSVSLAEGNQAARMMRSAAKLDRYIRRWNWKEISNTWLEFTYGWKPLAQDLYDSVKEINRAAPASQRLKIDNRMVDRSKSTTSDSSWLTSKNQEFSVRSRIGFVWTPDDSVTNGIARFSSLNPVSIAWELVPYSFVVDWFFDIGGYVRSLESALSLSGIIGSGYLTETTRSTANYAKAGMGANPDRPNTSVSGNLVAKRIFTTFSRLVITELPFPRRVRFKPQLGSSRLLSAAALLSQFVSSAKPPKRRAPRLSNDRFKRLKTRLERGTASSRRWLTRSHL